jgi:tRNA(Ile)-lysidine synthase
MLDKVLTSIKKYHLFSPGDHVLVAVSGGADSVSMLHVMYELATELQIQVGVAHLNHKLRGHESDGDEDFVRQLAERLKIPYVSGVGHVQRLAGEKGISIEMAAREVRYDFFARAAKKAGANTIVTGHTADDQAETVLLKLARGAGAGGLGGIPRETMTRKHRVVRPLLDVTREDVLDFLNERGLSWREDRTNADTVFLRNRVRHVILPIMEKGINPKIREALNRSAEIFQSENRWLDEIIAKRLAESVDEHHALRVKTVKSQPVAARRRIIRSWLIEEGILPEKIDFETVERIDTLLQSSTRSTNITGSMTVKKRYGTLTVVPSEGKVTVQYRVELNVPGETILPDQSLRIVITREPGLMKDNKLKAGRLPAKVSICSESVGRKKIYIRSWKNGDRMRPFGLGGSRKLQDIFVDEKVPVEHRGDVPILICGKEIIWIPGYRVS